MKKYFINNDRPLQYMATLESVESEIKALKKEVKDLRKTVLEEKVLSKHARDGLQKARETPESEYTELV